MFSLSSVMADTDISGVGISSVDVLCRSLISIMSVLPMLSNVSVFRGVHDISSPSLYCMIDKERECGETTPRHSTSVVINEIA